ncbi:MAG: hypothetical protein OXT51_10670 [Chloroflexota bacterium]|nr:hypothetical protein [Chloroflexota bacterium]
MKDEISALTQLKIAAFSASVLDAMEYEGSHADQLREWGHAVPNDVLARENGEAKAKGKKRGAPRGNQNARRHGLYSRLAPAPRRGDMAKALAMKTLTDDIVVVRLMLAHLLEDPEKNMKDIIQLFRLLTQMFRATNPIPVSDEEAEAQEILDRFR